MLLGLPLVIVGVLENYIPYRIVGPLAKHTAQGSEDALSTMKVLAGMLIFPAIWLALSIGVGMAWSWSWAALHLVLAPLCARVALWFLDRVTSTIGGVRLLWSSWIRRDKHTELVLQRDAIIAQLLQVEAQHRARSISK